MLRSHRLSVLAALITVLVVPATASAATETFAYTGGVQTWTVPAGVYSATFRASGAAGAPSRAAYPGKRASGFEGGGGGGASDVRRAPYAAADRSIVAAGAGGGGGAGSGSSTNAHGGW